MKVFKKIFNYSSEDIKSEIERRRSVRYIPSKKFPLVITIKSKDQNYECEIVDLSYGGIKVILNHSHSFNINDVLELMLTLDMNIIYHLRTRITYAKDDQLGMEVLQDDFKNLNNYFQTVLPISVGKSLVEYGKGKKDSRDEDVIKKVYMGINNTSLTFWHIEDEVSKSVQIKEFEFNTEEYVIRGQSSNLPVDVYSKEDVDSSGDKMSIILNKKHGPEKTKEILRFFNWVILNIEGTLPDEFVQYLESFQLSS